jgi:sarcosine oxidase subunit beta
MKTTAECVIVGGGVVGLSIAYHLAARGMTDVLVLEREHMVGTGSTGRCAGGFRHQFSNEPNIRLSLLSIEKLTRFADEMEQPLDLHQDGYLFLLSEARHVVAFEEQVALQQRLGIPTRLLEPGEIASVLPGTELNLDDVLAATYCPADGVSDPAGVTEGYRRNAMSLGVAIETGQEVVGIETAGGRVTGVRTANARVDSPFVVNAAGPFAGVVGRMAGVEVPVEPARRFIWTTHPFDGAPSRWTLVIDFTTGFYFHRESGGVLFGMGNRKEPSTFSLDVDWEFFESVVTEVGTARFPALADAAVRASWAGSYEMSPDANPILGSVPAVEGFMLANGFSGHGFQHAPGVGQLIAEEIVDGRASTLDISSFSIRRFDDGDNRAELGVV